jgi:hypothetical protein
VTDPVHVPPPLEAFFRSITDRAGGSAEDPDVRASTFARGLALGALVGAAIAGSTIWQRRHSRTPRAASTDETPTSTDAVLGPDDPPVA